MPQLLDAIVAYLPSPADRPFTGDRQGRQRRSRAADEKAPAAAFVWKTIADPFAGRITMFRVVSGALKADSNIHNKTRDASERLGHLLLLQGKTQTTVPEIKAGDLGAVAKLKDTLTNDTLGDKSDPVAFPPIKFPEPVLVVRDRAEEPRRRRQDQHVDAPPRGRGSRRSGTAAIRRPKSCCSPARVSCTSR